MTEPITPIDPAADLRGQIVDVVRSRSSTSCAPPCAPRRDSRKPPRRDR